MFFQLMYLNFKFYTFLISSDILNSCFTYMFILLSKLFVYEYHEHVLCIFLLLGSLFFFIWWLIILLIFSIYCLFWISSTLYIIVNKILFESLVTFQDWFVSIYFYFFQNQKPTSFLNITFIGLKLFYTYAQMHLQLFNRNLRWK